MFFIYSLALSLTLNSSNTLLLVIFTSPDFSLELVFSFSSVFANVLKDKPKMKKIDKVFFLLMYNIFHNSYNIKLDLITG